MRSLGSVRTRLLLMVTAVVLVAVAAVGWSSRRVTRVEFGQFLHRLETDFEDAAPIGEGGYMMTDLAELGDAVQAALHVDGDWSGAERILAGSAEALAGRVALVVVDRREIAAASDDTLVGAEVSVSADGLVEISGWNRRDAGGVVEGQALAFRGPFHAIRSADGDERGVLYVLPTSDALSERRIAEIVGEDDFLGSVDRWMLGVVVVVGVLAIGAAVLVSGRIVGPIERLTEASRRMGGGELGHRVEVISDDEIGKLGAAFNAMAASLEHNEKLRRDMVSDVAHELRTPLTNLRGQLEAVQDGLVEPTPELIGSLHEEAMLLSHLVNDLQELALADAGQLRLEIEEIDVAAEIARSREVFVVRGDNGSGADIAPGAAAVASIEMDIADELPRAKADVQRLRQVLGNLLENAVQHGGGGVVIAARATPQPPTTAAAFERATAPNGYVAVTVTDDGPGIAPDQLDDVFERFYRTDPSRQRATGGAGLGLAIVRQLVESQGGSVWVESELGGGSTFGFCLPAAT